MTSAEQLKADVKSYAKTIEDVAAGTSEFGGIAGYFEDVLDVEIICDLRGNYRGAKIWLALGGPGICLETRESAVKGYWGSDSAEWHVRSFATNAIDDYFNEIWDMTRC